MELAAGLRRGVRTGTVAEQGVEVGARVAGLGFLHVGVDPGGGFEDLRKAEGEVGKVVGGIGIPDVASGHNTRAGTSPLLLRGILGVHKEVEDEVLRVIRGLLDGGDGGVLQEAGEVEEVDVLAVRVEDRVRRPFQGGSLDEDYRSLREA